MNWRRLERQRRDELAQSKGIVPARPAKRGYSVRVNVTVTKESNGKIRIRTTIYLPLSNSRSGLFDSSEAHSVLLSFGVSQETLEVIEDLAPNDPTSLGNYDIPEEALEAVGLRP